MTQGCCQGIGEGWHQRFKNIFLHLFSASFSDTMLKPGTVSAYLIFQSYESAFFHIIVKSGDPAGGTIDGAFSLAILVLLLRYQYANLNNREGDSKRK